jgi:uncharacterized protein (DUF58 family)
MRFASVMSELQPAGNTDLQRSVRTLGALNLREGLVVLISDFFDPAGAEGVLAALKRLRHRILLVQLVRPSDRDPGLLGDLQLRDCESGAVEDVSATPAILERYRAAYDEFQDQLTGFANQRGIGMLQLDVEQDVLGQLGQLFEMGRMAV